MAGIDDVTPHISLEGADETSEQFRQVADAAQEMAAKINAALEGLSGAGDGIEKAAAAGKKALEDLGVVGAEAFAKILEAAANGNIVPAVTAVFGKLAGTIAELAEQATRFVEAQASMVETLSNLADATGMSLTQIEALKDAFASVGISTSGFERSIGRLAITISNEWASIQQAVRTSADAQTGAMLSVQSAANNLTKAHHEMDAAITDSSHKAQANAIGIEQAAQNMRKAGEALHDFSLQSQGNSIGIESATIALKRAQLNLLKDEGYDTKAQEKALKLESDKVQVKEAQLRLSEAENKKAKESLEMEELQTRAKKSAMDLEHAKAQAIEDSVKASDRLKDAQLHIQQSALAVHEAQEKQHEQELKDIPAIAKEIDAVANKQKSWDDVVNHTEISAQNLTKAIILAASGGNMGKTPETLDVFKEMLAIFPQITDKAERLAIIQHTMGAGMRAGQASAAQISAVMERFGKDIDGGKKALDKLFEDMEKFSKVKIGGFDQFAEAKDKVSNTAQALKDFNAASASLDGVLEGINNRFAAILSKPLTAMFDSWKESILADDGVMRRLYQSLGDLLSLIARIATAFGTAVSAIAQGVNKVASVFQELTGIPAEKFFDLLGIAVAGAGVYFARVVPFLGAFVTTLAKGLVQVALFPLAIGLMITALGDLVKGWAYARTLLPTWLGGASAADEKATFEMGQRIEAMGQKITRAAAKMTGLSDETLNKISKATGENGVGKGVFGDSMEKIESIIAAPAKDQQSAAKDQIKAGKDQLAAAEARKKQDEDAAHKDPNKRDADDPAGIKYMLAKRDKEEADRRADPQKQHDYDVQAAEQKAQRAQQELQDAKNALAAQKEQFNKDYGGSKTFNNDTQGRADQAKWAEEIKNAIGQLTQAQQRIAQAEIDAKKTRSAADEEKAKPVPAQTPEQKQATDSLKVAADAFKTAAQAGTTGAADTRTAAQATGVAAQGLSTATDKYVAASQKFETVGNLWNSVAVAFQIAIGKINLNNSGGGGDGKAGGGMIRGPGTPTSDQAGLFALSDGEYVVRSAAVSHYGPQLFEALNNLAFGGFATGGIVGPRAPSLTGAGNGGPSSILNLSIDGNHFNGLKAPEAVASKLKSYAVSRQSSSAQKMPTWMR